MKRFERDTSLMGQAKCIRRSTLRMLGIKSWVDGNIRKWSAIKTLQVLLRENLQTQLLNYTFISFLKFHHNMVKKMKWNWPSSCLRLLSINILCMSSQNLRQDSHRKIFWCVARAERIFGYLEWTKAGQVYVPIVLENAFFVRLLSQEAISIYLHLPVTVRSITKSISQASNVVKYQFHSISSQ